MSEEYAYYGNNEKYPCEFHNWLVDHPEVKAVRLKWTWNNRTKFNNMGLRFDSYLDTVDMEYSFAGLREDALEFLTHYDCWDWIPDEIEREPNFLKINQYGIMDVEHQADDPSYFDFDKFDDNQPDQWDVGDLLDNADEDIEGLVYQWVKDHDDYDNLKHHLRAAGL